MAEPLGAGGASPSRWVPLAAIRPSPYQPRAVVSEEDVSALAESIRQHGVVQPVVVRPVAGAYELVAGERRWRAAAQAGLEAIPAVVREIGDREAAVLAMIENLQRRDLHFLEEAQGYKRLLDEFNLTQQELARQLGLSQSALANKLRLLGLEAELREAIRTEPAITERHARALVRLPDGTERRTALKRFVSGGMTVRRAEAWVEARLARGAAGQERRGAALDLRDHLHALRRAVRDLRAGGYSAELTEADLGEAIEIRVRIGKERSRARS